MSDGPTPHLEGTRGDYAPTVLLPGDPRRARYIAETYLKDVRLVNAVRGAEGFTGTYEGTPVSVQSVGMGIPSAAIYYTELIRFYGVQNLVRVGSAGGLSESIGVGDVVIATAAGTDSAAITQMNEGVRLPPTADFGLLRRAVEAAEANKIEVSLGTVFTADLFYGDAEKLWPILQRNGVLGVEMEIACLYAVAALEGVKALGLVTISDDLVRGNIMSSAERENTFANMMKVALALA